MMAPTNERWPRVKEVFDAVVDLAPAERAAMLDRSCGDDTALRGEIESLLQSDAAAHGFIESAVAEVPRDLLDRHPKDEPAIGRLFGAYKILREIGRGGLGAVYLAARADEQYQKQVAVKLVRRGLDTDDILRRFRNERQILAQLDHPNIARLIDGGTTAAGLPYFVMEYVEGESILTYCDMHALTTANRLKLFRKVCAAVTYAHQHLVIHRDLKPSNILVTREGEPKLLDFGIAKVLSADDGQSLTLTLPALRAMTPEYASPEQIKGGNITTTTDVYSLGVLLFELLTGQRPYRLTSHTPGEIARAITDQEPERPSAAVTRSTSHASHHSRRLHGDLDNIVLMAMRKEPARRYTSVGQFSEDIRRHLEGLPVIARKDTWSYRSGKFVRRHKVTALATILVLLALVAGIIAFASEARVAHAQRDQARIEKANAERVSAFLQNVLLLADPSWINNSTTRGQELTVGRLLETAALRARKELADQPSVLAGVLRSIGNTYRAQGNYDEAERTLREARDILIRARGAQDYDAMNVSYNLAQCLMVAGKYVEAERLFRIAVPFFRQHVNRADDAQLPLLAGALNDFGFLLRSEGHPDAAEALLLEAMQFASRWHGASRALVGIHESVLGLARDDQGDLDGAEKYERAAVAELRALPGGDRIELASALLALGHVLTSKGDFANAEAAIREGLSIAHRLLGDAHPNVATGLDRLARLQLLQGDAAAAQQSADQAIAIQNAKLPTEHLHRAYPLTTLGLVLTHAGRASEAEAHLQRAVSLREKNLPPNHWLVAETKLALGESLSAQNKPAESMLVAGYEGLKASLGPDHPRTRAATLILAKFYATSGRPDLAAQYQKRTLTPP